MNTQIELAIDLGAITAIVEMYPDEIDAVKISALIHKIVENVQKQPSAEMVIDFLMKKYNV